MPSSDVTLRAVKGSKLTVAEVDGNFQVLVDTLDRDADGADELFWSGDCLVIQDRLGVGGVAPTGTEGYFFHPTDQSSVLIESGGDQRTFLTLKNTVGNYQVRVNNVSGQFDVVDVTAVTVPFRIEAGAPAWAIFVESATGWIGHGTQFPGEALHVLDTDSTGTYILVENDDAQSTAGFMMKNDERSWQARVREVGVGLNHFEIRDVEGAASPFTIHQGSTDKSVILYNGANLAINDTGGNGPGTSFTGALVLYNGTQGSPVANGVHVYSKDVAASAEAFMMDEAGNAVQQTPHVPFDEELGWSCPVDAIHRSPWVHSEENEYLGLRALVDMWGLVAEVERLSGRRLVWERWDEPKPWDGARPMQPWMVEKLRQLTLN